MIFEYIRNKIKKKYPETRALYTVEQVANDVWEWNFDEAFKKLIFASDDIDSWWRIILFGVAASHAGDVSPQYRWQWRVMPRFYGYITAWSIGYRYNPEKDELIAKKQ